MSNPPSISFGDENLRRLWESAFDEVRDLVQTVMDHATYELIESRYATDKAALTDGMHACLRYIHHGSRDSVLNVVSRNIADMRTIDPYELQMKADELEYEGAVPFILSALLSNKPRPYSQAQNRDLSMIMLSAGVELEFATDDLPPQERMMFREFYASRYYDQSMNMLGYRDAALAAHIMGHDVKTMLEVAGRILGPFEGPAAEPLEYADFGKIRIPLRSLAMPGQMEEMVRMYTKEPAKTAVSIPSNEQSVRERWLQTFEQASTLVCQIMKEATFPIIETRYSDQEISYEFSKNGREFISDESFMAINDETRGHLRALYHSAANAVQANALMEIAELRVFKPAQLEEKAKELGYDNPTSFILSAILVQSPRFAYQQMQMRDKDFQWIGSAVDMELGGVGHAFPFRAIHGEFYTNRMLDYVLRSRTFFDSAIAATIMNRNFDQAIVAAKNIVDPFVDKEPVAPSYSNIDKMYVPHRDDAVMPRLEQMIRHYTQ